MTTLYTELDFDRIELHDHLLRGVNFLSDFKSGRADLALDIDYIADQRGLGPVEYMLAAADLVFHGVTGLKLSIDWGDDRFQVVCPGAWIRNVERVLVVPQLVYFDRQYWRWSFELEPGSKLVFGAYGFTLQLRQEPICCPSSEMPLALRAAPGAKP